MRALLISTYDLGTQPLALANLARTLLDGGHEVRTRDLAVEALVDDDASWAQVCAFSVPMHTALDLALATLASLRQDHPEMPMALFGLYAGVGVAAGVLQPGDLAVAGKVDGPIVEWLAHLASPVSDEKTSDASRSRSPSSKPVRVQVDLGRPKAELTPLPYRAGLPPLSSYARFIGNGSNKLVGSLEATSGCSHRCRHCPVPVVYEGRTRAVAIESVLEDALALVEQGAGHIHFTDPDFLNRPQHARQVVETLARELPSISYDVTVKVSHILAYQDMIDVLADTGCQFVTTAIESVSDVILDKLDKGHTAQQSKKAVIALRQAGIEPRPSLLAFTPWTTRRDLVELLDFVVNFDLVWNVDLVQWGIRLLLPPGSLLLVDPDPILTRSLEQFDSAALGWSWSSADPLIDEIQQVVSRLTERLSDETHDMESGYGSIRQLILEMLDMVDHVPAVDHLGQLAISKVPGPKRPRLSESWFCCAAPTASQRALAKTRAN